MMGTLQCLALSLPMFASDLLAIRVGRAETISQGVIEHAVILIEDGKIAAIGQDLSVERGIPVLDRPDWTVMPGLVNPYTRLGLESRGVGSVFEPQRTTTPELFPPSRVYAEALRCGVTTMGQYPPGTGVPGQAIAIRPSGESREAMLLSPASYLTIVFRSDAKSKKMIKDAFQKVDEYLEKETEARKKWEKDQEKKTSKKPADKKSEEPKGEEKKEEAKEEKKEEKKEDKSAQGQASSVEDPKPEAAEAKSTDKKAEGFVPPVPDEKVKPFLDLRNKKARALVHISQAADWLHWLDAIEKQEFEWALRVPVTRELDLFHVAKAIGERKARVVMEPQITLHPGTIRQRNPAAELAAAGALVCFIPRGDSVFNYEYLLRDVGQIVAAGMPRDAALRGVTLEPAAILGLAERVGSLEVGKDANFLFLSGDPFEAATQVRAVMLEGTLVFEEGL